MPAKKAVKNIKKPVKSAKEQAVDCALAQAARNIAAARTTNFAREIMSRIHRPTGTSLTKNEKRHY